MLLIIVFVTLLGISQADNGDSITSNLDEYTAGNVLNITCDATNVLWKTDDCRNCFLEFDNSSQPTISTVARDSIKALTVADNGNYSCGNATLEIIVEGIGVFDQLSLTSIANNSYFVADEEGLLNVQLHCISATGYSTWSGPNGSNISKVAFMTETVYNSTALVQRMIQTDDNNDDQSGSGIVSAESGSAESGSAESGSAESGSAESGSAESGSAESGSGLYDIEMLNIVIGFNNTGLEGYYKCIDDSIGFINIGLFLFGRAPPIIDNVTVTANPVLSGTYVNLTCAINNTGIPDSEITWYYNGMNISSLQSFSFNVTEFGNYTCSLSNIVGRDTETVVIEQGFSPKVMTNKQEYFVILNDNLTITCNATGYPTPDVSIELNGKRNRDSNEVSVTINQVTKSLTGQYKCIGNNTFHTDIKNFSIIVQYAPEILTTPTNIVLNHTQQNTTTLNCSFIGEPIPDINWYYNASILSNDSETYVITTIFAGNNVSSQIVINNITPYHTGLYTCIANNTIGTSMTSADITVNAKPIITIENEYNTGINNTSINITCISTGVPQPRIFWYKVINDDEYDLIDNDYIQATINTAQQVTLSNGLYEVSQILTIDPLNLSYTGDYICSSNNSLSDVEVDFSITVQYVPIFSEKLANVTLIYTEQNSSSFECSLIGIPLPSVTWYNNNKDLISNDDNKYNVTYTIIGDDQVNSTLTILNIAPSDTGNYTCNGSNIVGHVISIATLTVHVRPAIVQSPQSITVIQPESAVLDCSADGIPLPSITWYKKGILIQDSEYDVEENIISDTVKLSTLTINQTDPFNTSLYTCNATNIAGYNTASANITVLVRAAIVQSPQSITVIQPESAVLDCSADGIPLPSITWYKKGILIQDSEYDVEENIISDTVKLSTLTINQTDPFDTSLYTCNATNIAGYDTASANITVLVEAMIRPVQMDYVANEHDDISFTCSATGIPTPNITWHSEDGNELTDDFNRISITDKEPTLLPSMLYEYNQTLTITNLTDSDTDIYYCVASNIANVTTHFNLTVNYGTRLINGLEDTTVNENDELGLSCQVEGRPHPSIYWWFSRTNGNDYMNLATNDDVMIEEQSITSYLTMNNISRSLHGYFKCNASNALGSIESTAFITVQFVADIINRPNDTTVVSPNTAIFTCTAEGRPIPDILWYNDTIQLTANIQARNISETLINSSIYIGNVLPKDDGIYTCIATNELNNISANATLTVHVEPTILTPSQNNIYIVNQSDPISVTCNATGIPQVALSWSKEGQQISDSLLNEVFVDDIYNVPSNGTYILTQQILYINNTNSTDTGNYMCLAKNTVGNTITNFSIFVQVPPYIIPVEGDHHIISIVNTSTVLEFMINNAAPDVIPDDIQWIFSASFTASPYDNNNINITENTSSLFAFSADNRQLTISNITQNNEGRYYFIASNPAGVDYNHIDIIVHGPPKLISGPTNETIISGNNVIFKCEGVADPQHDVTWTFNNNIIGSTFTDNIDSTKYILYNNDSEYKTYGSLSILNIQYDDHGIYQCSLNNTVTTINGGSAQLTVHIVPVVHNISAIQTMIEINELLTIQCIATGYPLVDFNWTKSGQILDSNTDDVTIMTTQVSQQNINDTSSIPFVYEIGSVSILIISSVKRDNTANYTCIAYNEISTDISDIVPITVLERPDPPINVTVNITSITSRTIDLSWKPAFDGNRDIIGYQVYYVTSELNNTDDQLIISEYNYTTSLTYFRVTDLIPYTIYQFKILACNEIGCTLSATYTDSVRTLTDAPDSPPRNCIARAINSTTVLVSWDIPLQPNGLIEYYDVVYQRIQSTFTDNCIIEDNGINTTANDNTSFTLTSLQKATLYSFSIIAYTYVGAGPSSIPSSCMIATDFDTPDTLPIINSLKPKSSTSLEIIWSLSLTNNIPCKWNGFITGYLLRIGELQIELNSTETSYVFTDLQIYTEYFVQVSMKTIKGYGESAMSQIVRTLNDTASEPQNVKTEIINSSSILVTWTHPLHRNGEIINYVIYYRSSFEDEDNELTVGVITEYLLTGLNGDTNYSISIAAVNGAGTGNKSLIVTNKTFVGAASYVPEPSAGIMVPHSRQFQLVLTKPSTINGPISHYHVVVVYLTSPTLPNTEPDELFPSVDSFITYEQLMENDYNTTVAYIAAEFADEDFPDDSMYIVGDDNEPDDGGYTNGLLKYGSSFSFFLRAYSKISADTSKRLVEGRQYTVFTSSGYYTDVVSIDHKPADNGGTVAAVVSVLVILLIGSLITIIIILLIIIFYRKRTQKLEFHNTSPVRKDQSEALSITSDFSLSPIHSLQNPAYFEESDVDGITQHFSGHPPIPLGEFGKIVDRLHANDNFMFSQEYDDICTKSPHPSVDVCLNPANKTRNRYANIQAYDHSRVKLIPVEGYPSDYINANFIHGYNRENEYIATQGPLPDTVGDFWRMVWDHNVTTIVMLTNLVEKMRVKCSQYWPEGVGLTERYANIQVTLNKCVTHADYSIRAFEIQSESVKATRYVKQFHYLSWPDFGVPRHSTPVLQFLRVVRRNHKYTDTRPMIVHCSAGVGRTGTLLTIDTEMQRAEHEGVLNPYSYVRSMRDNRNHMVQTETQYVFLHDALLEVITTGWTDIGVEQLADRMTELEEENDQGESGYLTEFNRLKSSQKFMDEYGPSMNEANKFKNRIFNALPFDHNRVRLTVRTGQRGSDYINASFIDGYKARNVFIAAQGPMENTEEDFWRMICEQQVHVIVMLCNIEENGQKMCHQYFPLHGGAEITIGDYHIVCTQELILEDYIHRQFKLTYIEDYSKEDHIIHHYQYKTWPKNGAPTTGASIVDLLDQVNRSQQQIGCNKPIVVHCSAGIGRTGTFCALSIAIERVKLEHLVNMFDTVKHLRTQRAHMVQTLEQYIFCYRAILEYVDSLSHYANFQTSI